MSNRSGNHLPLSASLAGAGCRPVCRPRPHPRRRHGGAGARLRSRTGVVWAGVAGMAASAGRRAAACWSQSTEGGSSGSTCRSRSRPSPPAPACCLKVLRAAGSRLQAGADIAPGPDRVGRIRPERGANPGRLRADAAGRGGHARRGPLADHGWCARLRDAYRLTSVYPWPSRSSTRPGPSAGPKMICTSTVDIGHSRTSLSWLMSSGWPRPDARQACSPRASEERCPRWRTVHWPLMFWLAR